MDPAINWFVPYYEICTTASVDVDCQAVAPPTELNATRAYALRHAAGWTAGPHVLEIEGRNSPATQARVAVTVMTMLANQTIEAPGRFRGYRILRGMYAAGIYAGDVCASSLQTCPSTDQQYIHQRDDRPGNSSRLP